MQGNGNDECNLGFLAKTTDSRVIWCRDYDAEVRFTNLPRGLRLQLVRYGFGFR